MANHPSSPAQLALRALLKEIRIKADLNQETLAQLLGKPQSYISKYESGERKLDYLEVRAVCFHCGTSVAALDKKLSRVISNSY